MTRGKLNRFAKTGTHGVSGSRLSIEDQRNLERLDSSRFDDNSVYLPNPTEDASFDRHGPQTYEQKISGLGLAPNIPKHFWQLIKGDSGAGSSIYRIAEIFQELGSLRNRTAATPYNKMIQLATMRSTDHRPRYFHASLFSVGRVFRSSAPVAPFSTSEVVRFASGIPAGTPSVVGNTQFGVPQFGTSQFRIMVHDESGQRFVDVDVVGTRSLNLYGFGVTVFALIKDNGYEIDRQRNDNPNLGPGILDQSLIGARIIPIRSNETQNPNNRTVSILSPAGPADPTVLPIPTGARKVQGYTTAAGADAVTIFFATVDPLNSAASILGNQGIINFLPIPILRTAIYDIPNSNAIVILNTEGQPSRQWIFTFEVTP